MHIIADSGSSKTEWVLCDKNRVTKKIETIGFNPYYYASHVLEEIIHTNLQPIIRDNPVSDIYFYGSGCSTENNQNIIINALRPCFQNSKIHIYHDLIGAARSLFGNEAGIAGILGTGSNSCVYDGTNITHNIPSLGYFFGDEGSGSNIGKRFINNYLKGDLPDSLKKDFDNHFAYSFEYILNQIYSNECPVKFFASFNPYIKDHIKSKYYKDLVYSSFSDFFRLNICKYTDYQKLPIKFIGSIAYIFSDILKEVASTYGVIIQGIDKNPMEGLIKFHSTSE